MKKIYYLSAIAAAIAAVSCVQEEAPVVVAEQEAPYSFSANFSETPEAKATLEPGVSASKVRWTAGDSVKVFADANSHKYKAATSDYSSELNFVKQSDEEVPTVASTYYAVHPFTDAATCSEGVITTTLPAVQHAVKDNFTHHLAVAKTTGSSFSFKNVCGLVRVDVQSDNVVNVVLQGKNNEYVAGGVNVTVSDTPTWTTVDSKGSKTITLVPAEGQDFIEKGVYFFAVLPQTFENGFSVKTVYGGGVVSALREVNTSITIERGQIVKGVIGSEEVAADETEGEGTEASPYLIKTKWDLVRMRLLATPGQATYFKLENNIDMSDITEWIPVNYDSPYDRQIFFDGNDKTLSNFSCNYKTYPSLFGVLYGEVKNLTVTNANIIATTASGIIGGYVGTIVEETQMQGVCNNVTVQGTLTTSSDRVGGFGGQGMYATLQECKSDVTITTSSTDAGGVFGKLTGENEITECNVNVKITSNAPTKNRVGGLIGWNSSAKLNIDDCHVLEGSVLTDNSNRSSSSNGNYGGFIGFGDTSDSELTISNSSSAAEVEAGNSYYNSSFIGGLGYKCKVSIENCSATGSVTCTSNYAAGLVGYIGNADAKVTIIGCHSTGDVSGAAYVGGIVGGSNGDCDISKTYSTGKVNGSSNYVGGLIGAAMHAGISISDSWSSSTVNAVGQQCGGLVGTTTTGLKMSNCYATGDVTSNTSGSAGIIGRVAKSSTITNCIAWNKNIVCKRTKNSVYAPGAVLGCAQANGTYSGCWRRNDMVLSDNFMSLSDQEDIVEAMPPKASYSNETHQQAYHGKAAPAGSTISSLATTLGWNTTIWDLTGDYPVLK